METDKTKRQPLPVPKKTRSKPVQLNLFDDPAPHCTQAGNKRVKLLKPVEDNPVVKSKGRRKRRPTPKNGVIPPAEFACRRRALFRTQTAAAAAFGVQRETVNKWEHGRHPVLQRTLMALEHLEAQANQTSLTNLPDQP